MRWAKSKAELKDRFFCSVRDRLERLTISDSVVFERVLEAGGRVVSLLVGIVLKDMVPAGICCVLQCHVTEL